LSSSLREAGFSVVPIDDKKGKLLKAKLMVLDLTKQAVIDVLFNMLMTANVAYLPLGEWRPYIDQHGNPVFPTKSEAAYPELLCRRVSTLVKQEAVNRGTTVPSSAYVATGAQEEARIAK